jgi:hypothetical protein
VTPKWVEHGYGIGFPIYNFRDFIHERGTASIKTRPEPQFKNFLVMDLHVKA